MLTKPQLPQTEGGCAAVRGAGRGASFCQRLATQWGACNCYRWLRFFFFFVFWLFVFATSINRPYCSATCKQALLAAAYVTRLWVNATATVAAPAAAATVAAAAVCTLSCWRQLHFEHDRYPLGQRMAIYWKLGTIDMWKTHTNHTSVCLRGSLSVCVCVCMGSL